MSYHHLTPFERGRLDTLHKQGHSIRTIAKELSRSPSTISRELRRFKDHVYEAEAAHQQYLQCRNQVGRKGKATHELIRLIEEKLEATWSPEQIVGRLLSGKLCVKTIYRWIYSGVLRVNLTVLRHKGKRRKPVETRGRFRVGTSIHKRPKEVKNRQSIGHWEADTMVSSRGESKGCLATFAERRSRLFLAFKMPDRTAASMMKSIETLWRFMGESLKTLTSDRGKEFACHEDIKDTYGIPIYFADPYSAWQRGTNENSNGLLREFFPKKTDLAKITDDELVDALLKINGRPRKCLDWKTPLEVFQHEVLHLI